MDARSVIEALSRLTLTAPARGRAISRLVHQQQQLQLPATPYQQRWGQRRGFSVSRLRRAPPVRAPAVQSPTPTPDQPTPVSGEMPSNDEIASFVDQSFQPGNEAAKRTSRFKSPYAQQLNRGNATTQRPWQAQGEGPPRSPSEATSRSRFRPLPENTSNNTYMGRRVPQQSPSDFGDRFESAMRRDPLNRGARLQSSAGFLDSFNTTPATPPPGKDVFDGLGDMIDRAVGRRTPTTFVKPLPKSSLRLGSSVGRSIEVDPSRGVDLVRGIGILDTRLSTNRVRSDHYRQRFHERPGLKRKRLKSERWRKKFKLGFRTVVNRVKYLTQMGW